MKIIKSFLPTLAASREASETHATPKAALALALAFLVQVSSASAQDKSSKPEQQPQQPAGAQQTKSGKEFLGPTADSIRPYRAANRDPFKKTIKPKEGKKSRVPRPLGFPPLDARRAEFRQKVDLARARDLVEPDPVTQYLVSEIDVTGVFRDERGYGAFVRAQPTGTMFFIRSGARLYNGEVVRIGGDESDVGSAKVMFREVSYLEVNGKQTAQERVVAKLPAATDKK
jgi:hypothetical protein